jgi:hypothetical protein
LTRGKEGKYYFLVRKSLVVQHLIEKDSKANTLTFEVMSFTVFNRKKKIINRKKKIIKL